MGARSSAPDYQEVLELSNEELFARCNTCGLDLPTPDDADAHAKETLQPTGEKTGVIACSHTYHVITPTREMEVRGLVGRIVGDAMDDAFNAVERAIDRGKLTQEDATSALRDWPDFVDAWDEWQQG